MPPDALDYIQICVEPNSFDPSIDLVKFLVLTERLALHVQDRFYEKFLGLNQDGLNAIKQKGYRPNILSAQEHALIRSSKVNSYTATPYISLGIVEDGLGIIEANRARGLSKFLWSIDGTFFGRGIDSKVRISLEPLDESGNTIRDPCIVDTLGNRVETVYAANFPFRRH